MSRVLVRFGTIPEVASCEVAEEAMPSRGAHVVLETHRGRMLGEVLEVQRRSQAVSEAESLFQIVGLASDEERASHQQQTSRARQEFSVWEDRIREWQLDLQLIDLEYSLDGEKVIVYVLNDRGADCTQLALQAAIAGLGLIDVQSVALEGLVTLAPAGAHGGGCGSGGGSCGCS